VTRLVCSFPANLAAAFLGSSVAVVLLEFMAELRLRMLHIPRFGADSFAAAVWA